jgi:cell division inhibitor SulA
MNKNLYSRIISCVLKFSYIRVGWVRISVISSTEVMSLHIHDKCYLLHIIMKKIYTGNKRVVF